MQQRKLVWFNYLPNIFEANNNTWIKPDTTIFGEDLLDNLLQTAKDSTKFEILAMQPTKKSVVVVFRVRNQVFFAQQYGEKFINVFLYTQFPKVEGQVSFSRRSIYAVCQDNEGDSRLINFKLDLDVCFE